MKILIVDDSKFSRMVIEKHLKTIFSEAEFYSASDGQEGFESYKEINPDYSFIDLLMPNVNGQELVKLLKDYDDKAQIFIVSADVQKSVKEEMESYGIIGFINKPFDEEKANLVHRLIKGDNNG